MDVFDVAHIFGADTELLKYVHRNLHFNCFQSLSNHHHKYAGTLPLS